MEAESDNDRKQKKSESRDYIINNICETILELSEKDLLFGGKKGKVPKFAITSFGCGGHLSNIDFTLKNVSSVFISNLQIQNLNVAFEGNLINKLAFDPKIDDLSLEKGESTNIALRNPILGYGPGYTNAYWSNIDLKMQFSCEDEENSVFWYEAILHIFSAEKNDYAAKWPIRYLG